MARLSAADAARLGLAGGDEEDDGGALAANAPLAICVWRTRASLSVLVTKAECDDMLEKIRSAERRLGGEGKVEGQRQVEGREGGGKVGEGVEEEVEEVVEEGALVAA